MSKFFKIVLNILVLSLISVFVYNILVNDKNNELEVTCISDYVAELNEMNLTCDVLDSGETISNDHPLTIYLYDADEVLLYEQTLSNGENIILFDFLDYNTLYQISIDGYNFIQKEYISNNYFEYVFSTISEGINIPTFILNEVSKSDLTYGFEIELTDIDSIVISILIELYNVDDSLLYNETVTDLENMEFTYEGLASETEYYIKVTALYKINDFNNTAVVVEDYPFTTLRTLLIPSAEISNVINDLTTLSFDLSLNDEDSTNVTYTVELLNLDGSLLDSLVPETTNVLFDVSAITGDYKITVKSSYLFMDITYTDIEILSFNIYNNDYSNFFIIPTLSIVDTSQPLSDYDDYANYIYSYLNEGVSEFTINCTAPVDCTELVNNSLYLGIPFGISNLLHPYYDIRHIGYSFTTTTIVFTTLVNYTQEEIIEVNQAINNILNSIITDEMDDNDKILAIHDYIINTSEYDLDCLENNATCDNDHTAIGILFDYNAVCEGYAHAMDIMLRALKIPSFRLNSDTHQWNVVYYDGGWYHVDPTWDDPITQNGTDKLIHDYFLITTEELNILDTTDAHDFSTEFVDFIE